MRPNKAQNKQVNMDCDRTRLLINYFNYTYLNMKKAKWQNKSFQNNKKILTFSTRYMDSSAQASIRTLAQNHFNINNNQIVGYMKKSLGYY